MLIIQKVGTDGSREDNKCYPGERKNVVPSLGMSNEVTKGRIYMADREVKL